MLTMLAAALMCVEPERPKAALHLIAPGDLDSGAYADRIISAISQAKDAVVLLELDGDSARWDLVDRVGAELAGVVVLLRDKRDGRVGVSQLMLGLGASRVYAAPATVVRTGDDRALRATAGDLSWKPIEDAILERVSRGLERRSAPPIGEHLVFPKAAAWISPEGDRVFAESAAGRDPVVTGAGDSARVEVSAKALERVGAVRIAADPEALLREEGVRATPKRRTIENPLVAAREKAGQALSACDSAAEELRDRLSIDPASTSISTEAKRTRGEEARDRIDGLLARLDEVDALTKAIPELLASAPPGQTSVTTSRSSVATRWRTVLQSRRDRLGKLRTQAELLAQTR